MEEDGVCGACLNNERKRDIDFESRQKRLTEIIKDAKKPGRYDCVIAVSGGKDSHMIVKRLVRNHGVTNALLVSVTDEFTHTKAGQHNIDNLVTRFNFDHITFRCQPQTFKEQTLKDFENELHPLKWIEEKIYKVPVEVAKAYKVPLVFFGENSAFEYGSSPELDVLHPGSDKDTSIIFMGAIYPYSIADSYRQARQIGFKDLDDFNEWPRLGSIEQFTQIDSIAYVIQLWTKYVKFGFQRVSDIACRFVREGSYTKEQAEKAIKEKDYVCDPMAKTDFCKTIGITEEYFDEVVDRHANTDLVEKRGGRWRLKT